MAGTKSQSPESELDCEPGTMPGRWIFAWFEYFEVASTASLRLKAELQTGVMSDAFSKVCNAGILLGLASGAVGPVVAGFPRPRMRRETRRRRMVGFRRAGRHGPATVPPRREQARTPAATHALAQEKTFGCRRFQDRVTDAITWTVRTLLCPDIPRPRHTSGIGCPAPIAIPVLSTARPPPGRRASSASRFPCP